MNPINSVREVVRGYKGYAGCALLIAFCLRLIAENLGILSSTETAALEEQAKQIVEALKGTIGYVGVMIGLIGIAFRAGMKNSVNGG